MSPTSSVVNTNWYFDFTPQANNQIDIDDGFLNLMTSEGSTKDDVKLPEGELGDKIRADFDDGKEVYVSITKAMNEEACLSYRVQ
jgi:translation initiation factor 5A